MEEASVVHAATVVTTGSDSTRGFQLIEKKQYISDIIARGGLNNFDFAALVEEKPSYYDDCAAVPNRREKYYNLCRYWKRTPTTYSKLLRQFGLTDKALGLKTPPRTPKSPAPKKSSSDRKPKAKRSVRNSNTNPGAAPTPAPAPSAVAPPPQVIRRPAPPLFQPHPSPSNMMSAFEHRHCVINTSSPILFTYVHLFYYLVVTGSSGGNKIRGCRLPPLGEWLPPSNRLSFSCVACIASWRFSGEGPMQSVPNLSCLVYMLCCSDSEKSGRKPKQNRQHRRDANVRQKGQREGNFETQLSRSWVHASREQSRKGKVFPWPFRSMFRFLQSAFGTL